MSVRQQGDDVASAAEQVQVLLEAARTGRLGYDSARRWAVLASRGEVDVSLVRVFAAVGQGVKEPHLSRLASELAAILGSGEPTGDEFASLWPPTSEAEADRRRTVAAAAQTVEHLDDDSLYRALWGDQ